MREQQLLRYRRSCYGVYNAIAEYINTFHLIFVMFFFFCCALFRALMSSLVVVFVMAVAWREIAFISYKR